MARGKASKDSNGSKKDPKGLKKSGKVSNLANCDASGLVETVKSSKEKSSSLSSRRLAQTRKKNQKTETQENITNGNKKDLTEAIPSENNNLNSEKMKVQKHAKQKSTSATKVRKTPRLVGKIKLLRSSSKGSPVTRLHSNKISKILSKGENNSMENSGKNKKERRKKHNKKKHVPQDELSRIKKRVTYLLNRIGFEQSMIDAYSNEGWKGQSQEKIRPEKELQKAASKISQCKVAIREAFHELHSICLQGSLEESAFDSEGQVNSEDIFCAKCGSKELFLDNDIILCDGACDRGFHQNCIEPPLATEDIPPGDEGWLCPGCDCKFDCVDLVNERLGTDFELEDSWENFFAEAVATADGNEKPLDLEGMPSDDSEDDDYDPDGPDLLDGTNQEDVSGSAESGSSSDSGSDGDDSDSDKDSESNEGSEASLGGHSDYSSQYTLYSGKDKSKMARDKKALESSDLPAISDPDASDNIDLPVSIKRNREQVDYKKLHDEVYGPDDDKSMSEDDEEWGPGNQSTKGKESDIEHDDSNSSKGKQLKKVSVAKRKAKLLDVKPPEDINLSKSSSKKVKLEKENGKCTVAKKENHHEGNDHKDALSLEFKSASKRNAAQQQQSGSCTLSVKRRAFTRLPTPAVERLHRVFDENRFPSRSVKEDIAKEVGVTYKQVHKWFDNARNSPRSPPGRKQVDSAGNRNSNNDCLHSHAKKEQVDSTVDRDFNNDSLDSHVKKEQADTTNDQDSNKSIVADHIVQQELKESVSVDKRRKDTRTLSGEGKKKFRGRHGNMEVKSPNDTGRLLTETV